MKCRKVLGAILQWPGLRLRVIPQILIYNMESYLDQINREINGPLKSIVYWKLLSVLADCQIPLIYM
jgi:hypothetical protein